MVTKKKDYQTVPATPLDGEALLKKLEQIGDKDTEDKARLCGYYTVSANGTKRADPLAFLHAFVEAKGLADYVKARHPEVIKVTLNHVLVIPSQYIRAMNCPPGDTFEVVLYPELGEIRLVAVDLEN